jgi:serine/threonine protein kinase/WD40 repeat protein
MDLADDAILFDLMVTLRADQASGALAPLATYAARFPALGARVALAYAEVSGPPMASVAEPQAEAPTRVGHFALERELGRGGQGTVYLARDERLGRQVALKVLHVAAAMSDTQRLRLRREAVALAALQHPAICPIHDADLDGPLPYLAMHYVAGESLAHKLELRRTSPAETQRPSTDVFARVPATGNAQRRIAALIETLARALHAAHESGILHRDVKPGNILIDGDGNPVLVDFGLAREAKAGDTLTAPGEAMGTLAYLAPERLDEKAAADRRTDVFSLGAVLYECLTDRRPFAADSVPALLEALRRAEPTAVQALNPAIDTDLQTITHVAIERHPDQRYATALAFADDLRRFRLYEPIAARPHSLLTRARRWCARHPLVASLAALTIAFLTVGYLAVRAEQRRWQAAFLSSHALLAVSQNPERALVVAGAAADIEGAERTATTDRALRAALANSHLVASHEASLWAMQGMARGIRIAAVAAPAKRPAVHVVDEPHGRSAAIRVPGVPAMLALTQDGLRLAVAWHDTARHLMVTLLDLSPEAEGAEVRVLARRDWPTGRVVGQPVLTWSPKRDLLAVCDGSAKPTCTQVLLASLDAELGVPICHELPLQHRCQDMAFAQDGARLLVNARFDLNECQVSIFRVAPPEPVAVLTLAAPVVDAAFVASSRVLCFTRSQAHLYEVESEPCLLQSVKPHGLIWGVTCAPAGEIVTLGQPEANGAGAVTVWDAIAGTKLRAFGHTQGRSAHRGTFSPAGKLFAYSSFDGTLHVNSWADGDETTFQQSRISHLGAAVWSGDERHVAAHGNSILRVWDTFATDEGRDVLAGRTGVRDACWRPSASDAALAVTHRYEVALAAAPGIELVVDGAARVLLAESAGATFVTFRGDGRYVFGLTGAEDAYAPANTARVWEAESGALVATHTIADATRLYASNRHDACAVQTKEGQIALWHWREGRCVPLVLSAPAHHAFFAADGTTLAVGLRQHTVSLVDVASGTERWRTALRADPTEGKYRAGQTIVLPRPDGALVAASEDGETAVLDQHGNMVWRLPEDTRPLSSVSCVAIAPGGRAMAIGAAYSGHVLITHAAQPGASGRDQPDGHDNRIASVTFHPDGTRLLTASWDGRVRVWRTPSLQACAELDVSPHRALAASFSPNGAWILTLSDDGRARLWRTDPTAVAQARLQRATVRVDREYTMQALGFSVPPR